LGGGLVELLVCNNYAHTVTRHLLDSRAAYSAVVSETLLEDGLTVPDGVAHSPSGRWLAVSNHGAQAVFVYRNDPQLCRSRAPDAVLHGVTYPHGLRFTPDEESLLVADAGAPFVHVFDRGSGDWTCQHQPAKSIKVMDDAAFRQGNLNSEEGGPKGIDVSPDGQLMVVTRADQPVAFFRTSVVLDDHAPGAAEQDGGDVELHREALLRFAVSAHRRAGADEEHIGGETRRELEALVGSRSWRLTAPLRRTAKAIRRLSGNTRLPELHDA
jgi:sugar lactone lactonase YvrE